MVSLEVKRLSEEIIRLDERIQYAAILDQSNMLLESKERGGVTSELTAKAIKEFVSITPLVMLGSANRLQPYFGDIEYIATKYEDRIMVIYQLPALFVVLILQEGTEPQIVETIAAALKKMTA